MLWALLTFPLLDFIDPQILLNTLYCYVLCFTLGNESHVIWAWLYTGVPKYFEEITLKFPQNEFYETPPTIL